MTKKFLKSAAILAASSVFAVKASLAGDVKLFASGGLLHSNDNYVVSDSEGKAGFASTNFIKNFGINLSGGAQYALNKYFYVNGEAFAQYRNASAASTNVSANSRYNLGALARLGVNVNDKSSVYLGAGVAYSPISISKDEGTAKQNVISPLLVLGMATDVTESLQGYVDFQISSSLNSRFREDGKNIRHDNRSLVLGVRKFFN
jgi:hypothetical protein